MTSTITKFDTSHEDLIHDVSYDFYGKRLVTCSSDQRLKVWDFVEKPDVSVWELNDVWKAHDASILKAIWAMPEFGQVIATCSFDRQVKIWEEQTIEPRNSQKRWAERFRLVESRGAVLDIAFAPTQNSLRLATCSSDGIVRVYEALEPTNLAQWSQMEEFEITNSNSNNNGTGGGLNYPDKDLSKNLPSGITLLQQQQKQQQKQQQQEHQQQEKEQQPHEQEQQQEEQQFQISEGQQEEQEQQLVQDQQEQQQAQDQLQGQEKQHHEHEQQEQQVHPQQVQSLAQLMSQSQPHQPSQLYQQDSLSQSSQPLQLQQSNVPQPQIISQYGFHQTNVLQTPQPPYPQQPYSYINPQHGYQPMNTQSTSSSLSSHTSHGLSTPGVSDIPTMTSATGNTSTGQGYTQGVSPVSSTGAGGVQTAVSIHMHKPIDADSGYCIDWCPNRSPTPMMVVGLGKEIGARIFKHDGHNRWIPSEYLPGHTQEVHDVSWAPNMARSYQLIATASKDHFVRIFKLTEQTIQQQQQQQQTQISQRGRSINSPASTPTQLNHINKSYQIELIAAFEDHKAEVWKVEWNITGTILSSSGDDGKLRLWTAGYDGKWRQMAAITANT